MNQFGFASTNFFLLTDSTMQQILKMRNKIPLKPPVTIGIKIGRLLIIIGRLLIII